jgi:hypothetical protein
MDEASAGQLQRVIESQHGTKSTFVKSVQIHRLSGSQMDWNGIVHVFDLSNHPKAKRAFAWSSPISGSGASRFFAVLQSGQIATPLQAVKAASSAIRKWGAQGKRN